MGPNQRALQQSGQTYVPVCTGTTNWMLLLYILGPLYLVVMAFVLWAICVRDRRHTTPEVTAVSLEAGFNTVGESKSWFRKVNRPHSAWRAARTGRAGGGMDMALIDRQIRMAFLRKVRTRSLTLRTRSHGERCWASVLTPLVLKYRYTRSSPPKCSSPWASSSPSSLRRLTASTRRRRQTSSTACTPTRG